MERFDLTIHGPLNAHNGTTLRSIYGCIPRSLPSSCDPHFYRLELHDIQYRAVADFVRLVRELYSLQELRGVRLTWSSDREEVLLTPARRWVTRSRLQKVELSNCTPHHRSSALLLVDSPGIYGAAGGLIRLVDGQLSDLRGSDRRIGAQRFCHKINIQ